MRDCTRERDISTSGVEGREGRAMNNNSTTISDSPPGMNGLISKEENETILLIIIIIMMSEPCAGHNGRKKNIQRKNKLISP